MSYRIYDTPALVVERWPYKESSTRFFLYTRELGRILARAQAVRKVAAKLQPALQRGGLSELELVCGKSGWRIVGAAPEEDFLLTVGFFKKQANQRFLQLLTRLIPAQQRDRDLYEIITAGLHAVACASDKETVITQERLLVLRTLVQLGYAPDPEARELKPFIYSTDFSDEVVRAFQPLAKQAVGQINQSLHTIQL